VCRRGGGGGKRDREREREIQRGTRLRETKNEKKERE